MAVMPDPKMAAAKPPAIGAGDPGSSATGAGTGGPTSSPMGTPQPMEGIQKAARVQIQAASEMLQRELPHFPLDSEEFKAISNALGTLGKAFGKSKDADRKLFPSDVMNKLALSATGPQAKTPGQTAMSGGAPGPGAMAPAA